MKFKLSELFLGESISPEEVQAAIDDISHKTDGPVDSFVLISRALDRAAQSGDEREAEVYANALHKALGIEENTTGTGASMKTGQGAQHQGRKKEVEENVSSLDRREQFKICAFAEQVLSEMEFPDEAINDEKLFYEHIKTFISCFKDNAYDKMADLFSNAGSAPDEY